MAFDLRTCSPPGTLDALAAAIAAAKGDDRLAPVTIVVPTNVAGVMARRALGRTDGILGVDMVTLNRFAELLAGPELAHQRRQPVSTPVLDLTVRRVLDEASGSYAAVAGHPATVVALRELHRELRLAGDEAIERLRTTSRGREAARVSAAVTRILEGRWYDEADLLAGAADVLRSGRPLGLDRVVFHLPGPLDELSLAFVRELGRGGAVSIVSALTGDADADHEQRRLLGQLGLTIPPVTPVSVSPVRVVSTTDADDEVRIAVRAIVDAARGSETTTPVPFERMAILWPSQRPYARLVEHHLTADGIAWNGRAGTELTERIAARLLLDLLDVDRRGLRRHALFELLADVPVHDTDGRPRPTADWERVSRVAGVSRDEDWIPRLRALGRREKWAASSESLLDFVATLRDTLGHPHAKRTWAEWADWSHEQLRAWLGVRAVARFSDVEYRAWEALMSALERLRHLDEVAEPVDRSTFRSVLESELTEAAVREGRIGTGVTVGSLASAGGLDVDVAVVLGASEGLLPPAPSADPLLSSTDRERAGLSSPGERAHRLHHELVSVIAAARTIVTLPRGDLRATTANQMSRWLVHLPAADVEMVDSSTAGLGAVTFAPCERERRLGDRLRSLDATDPVLVRNLAMRRARESSELTGYDGDLSTVSVPAVAPASGTSATAVSPTQIQSWASCPHGYFVEYLLGVRPLDEREGKIRIEPLDRGNVVHDTLDAFHRDVIAGSLSQPTDAGWTVEHLAALLERFDTVCEAAEAGGRTGRPATWARERATIRSELVEWLEGDSEVSRSTGVTVLASERSFPDVDEPIDLSLPDGRRLAMKGKIDRLDRRADGTLVVTDHKTGNDYYRKLANDDPTLDGTVFQLPAYAAAALRWAGADDDTAVRAEYSMFRKGRYNRPGIAFDSDVWNRVEHDLGEIVAGIEAGWFPRLPARPGFSFYTECLYCDPDELGTTEAWAQWSAKRSDPRTARWFDEQPESTDE